MSDLRLILVIAGICIIAGIYLWGTWQLRKRQRQQTVTQHLPVKNVPQLKISTTDDAEIDYSSALAGLNESISRSKEGPGFSSSEQLLVQNDNPPREQVQLDLSRKFSLEKYKSTDTTNQRKATSKPNGLELIVLHIISRGKEYIEGSAILHAASKLEMTFSTMQVFHHYGIGEMKKDEALFSLANMMEPGDFDLENIDRLTTPGLVIFMTLPTVIDDQVVFELMLNTAQRLAAFLGADVCDENRALINEKKIELIRKILEAEKE